MHRPSKGCDGQQKHYVQESSSGSVLSAEMSEESKNSGHGALPNGNSPAKKFQVIEDVIHALVAYSIPPSAATSWSGSKSVDSNRSKSSSNHLTCLVDSHNIANIGRNKDVSSLFIQDRGVNRMSDYQGLVVDEKQGMIVVECCSSICRSKMPLVEARRHFKSCHHCYTYYCCARCREIDWQYHKMTVCPVGRAASAVKSVIKKLLSDEAVHNTFSNLGRGGYLRLGRGCVVVWFSTCSEAEKFSEFGTSHLKNYPVFVSIKNINLLISRFVPNSLSAISEACNAYDTDRGLVVSISVAIDEYLLRASPAKMRHSMVHAVKKCVTISLSDIFLNSITSLDAYQDLRPTSLLLTMLPNQQYGDDLKYEDRQVIFVNILRRLESRGVSLEHQYPALYRNLINFVEKNEVVPPTTIYPTDASTGQAFVCMIAPQSDPVTSRALFDNSPSNRSSVGSFMAELEAVTSDFHRSHITDL